MRQFLLQMANVFGFTGRRDTAKCAEPSHRRQLRVERLESRDVPAVFYVTDPGDSGPGTLRQAIIDAQVTLADGDEIVITQAVRDITLLSTLPTLVETHTIRAETTEPIIDHVLIHPLAGLEHSFRFLRVTPNGAALLLKNIDLQFFGAVNDGTSGSGRGGAIYADGDVRLDNCVITDCYASAGGGALAVRMSLTLNSCILSGNTTDGNGGAIWSESTSVPAWYINDSDISDNTAGGSGGAIYLLTPDTGQLNCSETTFIGNKALGGNGGAICQIGGILNVTDASSIGFPGGFIGNQAFGKGGAIYMMATKVLYVDAYSDGNLDQVTGLATPRLNFVYIEAPRPDAYIYVNPNRGSSWAVIIEQ